MSTDVHFNMTTVSSASVSGFTIKTLKLANLISR